jgi:hypothetical protein
MDARVKGRRPRSGSPLRLASGRATLKAKRCDDALSLTNAFAGMLVCGARIKINTVKRLRRPRAQGAGPRAHDTGASIQQSQQLPPNLTPLLLSCCKSNHDHQCTDIHGIAQNHATRDARNEQKTRARKVKFLHKSCEIHAKNQCRESKLFVRGEVNSLRWKLICVTQSTHSRSPLVLLADN